MAVPAGLAFTFLCHPEVHLAQLYHFRGKFRMAADAVVHNHLGTGVFGGGNLGLAESQECRSVFHPVHTLESILAHHILVRHVAVIASDRLPAAVGRMVPSSVIGLHNMAIDARGRVITQICRETQHIQEETSAANENARQAQQEHFLPKL